MNGAVDSAAPARHDSAASVRQAWAAAEFLSRDALEALMLQRLREQVRRLIDGNPFHRDRFRAAGVNADSLKSLDDLRRFPLMDKADVLADSAEAPPFGRRLGVEPARIREILTSGGTAGKAPEVHAFTLDDLETCIDLYALDQYWKGARPGDVAMMVSQIGMLASPPLNVRAWERLGMPVLRVGPNTTEERIAAFARFKPAVLKLPYVYAKRFMHACRAQNVDPRRDVPNLKFVVTSGGAYPLAFAEEIESFFGAPLHEVYGCSQAGSVVAGTCEAGASVGGERGLMHTFDHEFIVEVLDRETGQPVADGDEGELVITPLRREASPVFRYRMNDRVRFRRHGICGCGRPFAAFECGTVARFDDMLRVKGVNMWIHDLDHLILSHPRVDEFNGHLALDADGRERATILVELHGEPAADAYRQIVTDLADRLRDAFRVRFDIEVVPHGTVRRFELKQRRWSDMRMDPS
ncbi:MAG: AMP-binding protein [Burkholderiaceae bacterium]